MTPERVVACRPIRSKQNPSCTMKACMSRSLKMFSSASTYTARIDARRSGSHQQRQLGKQGAASPPDRPRTTDRRSGEGRVAWASMRAPGPAGREGSSYGHCPRSAGGVGQHRRRCAVRVGSDALDGSVRVRGPSDRSIGHTAPNETGNFRASRI